MSALLSASGIPIIDADLLAREAVVPGSRAFSQIVASFGPEIILPDGSLDRKKLGAIIFNDDAKRKKLNSIVHPAVTRAILWHILKFWIRGKRMCVVDVPLLIEGGLWKWMGRVVVVYWCVSLLTPTCTPPTRTTQFRGDTATAPYVPGSLFSLRGFSATQLSVTHHLQSCICRHRN